MSPSSGSSRAPNAPVHSPSPLSVTTTPQKPPHSRARIHGHVGAPLGMSPISSPVVPTQAPTGMYANANGNGNGNGHEHEQCRSPSRDPSSESASASHSKSGSGSVSRKNDYEPSAGGRGGQMFGVRLVRALPRSRNSVAGPGTGTERDVGRTTTLAAGEEGETGMEGAVANGRGRPLRKSSESDEVEDTPAGPSPAAADNAGPTAAPPSTQTSMPMTITIPAPLAITVPIPVPEFKLKDTGPLVISWD